MTTPAAEDDFTELVDFHPDRVDLVGKGANGIPRFLIAKQDASAGVLEPAFVRSLIAKSAPDRRQEAELPNGITLTGSPAAMAAFIHSASVRKQEDPEAAAIAKALAEYEQVVKAKYSAADRKAMAGNEAMADGSYPVKDAADLTAAIRAVGRGGAEHDAIRRHVIKRAKALGKSSEIPDNWASDGSLKEKVSKDMGPELDGDPDAMDALDVTMPLAEPMEMGPGDPNDPGSPAWEGIDAASASKALSILARVKNATLMLAEREMLEAASADPSDAENAFNLEDAACAIDYAISLLAVFAASEQAEAEIGAEMEAMCKALASFDPAPLVVVEGLTAVRKAGRVLSSANEAAIRGAVDSLQKVLASLPEAPVAKSKEAAMTAAQAQAADVAKETASPDEQARDTGPVNAGGTTGMGEPRMTGPDGALPGDGPQKARPGDAPGRTVVKSALTLVFDQGRNLVGVADAASIVQQVTKADDGEKKAMQAVFDQDGDLIGIVDPDAIQPVTGAGGKPADDTADDDGMQDAPAADDMTPQPSADAGTPAEDVAKAGTQNVITVNEADLGSIIAKAVAAAVDALAPAQDVAKQADVAGALAEVETLKARIAKVEETPAAPKVFTNGAVPPASQLRGQDQGAGSRQVDVAKALGRKQDLYHAPDAATQNQIANEMQADAIGVLASIHRG